jgi:hypothetical protein
MYIILMSREIIEKNDYRCLSKLMLIKQKIDEI